jgi:hypothetical protein
MESKEIDHDQAIEDRIENEVVVDALEKMSVPWGDAII